MDATEILAAVEEWLAADHVFRPTERDAGYRDCQRDLTDVIAKLRRPRLRPEEGS